MGEIEAGDILRVLWKELRVGVIVGVLLGLVNYIQLVIRFPGQEMLCLTVVLSLLSPSCWPKPLDVSCPLQPRFSIWTRPSWLPAYYHHCGCGEPDYIFSAGLQPAEDLGRMFRAGILFLYRIPAFALDGFRPFGPRLFGSLSYFGPHNLSILKNPLLTMGNRFYYNKGKL